MITASLLKSSSAIALIVAASAALLPSAASAQTWTGAVSDDYADGRNWSGGVAPAPGAVVTVNTNTNAPVVDTGRTVNGGQLSIGSTGTGTVTVRRGGVLNTSSVGVGGGNDGTGGNGTLLVTGSGSLLTATAQLFVGIRDISRGTVTVSAGGVLRAQSMLIGGGNGLGANANGTVTVTGAGSLIDVTSGLLSMGGNTVNPGRGTLNILDGGRVTGGNGTTNFVNAVSAINISGANSLLSSGAGLTINGALLIADGGTLNYAEGIAIGGTATMRNGTMIAPRVGSSGGIGVVAGGTLVADTSTITVGSNFSVAGTATLSGTALTAAAISISQNGIVNIGGPDGAAASAPGTITAPGITVGEPNSRLVFNHIGPDLVVVATISGNGRILHRSGTTIFTAPNPGGGSITGIDITGGTLLSNGRLRGNNVTVSGGGTLGGTGQVEGSVAVTDGIITPGNRGAGTLTLGNLSLTAASILNYDLGAPGTPGVGSDLIQLGNINTAGNLTLDGTLNVNNVGGFGAGLYRLINYNGTLTNNGLAIGLTPTGFGASELTVQTATARQVNLLVGMPAAAGIFNFWDGANTTANNLVDGGTGTWRAAGGNWTLANGSSNGAYDPNALLIFSGAAGTVAVDNTVTPIPVASGMQFATNGYTLTGGALQLTAPTNALAFGSTIRVGDGTAAGAAITANIATALTGPSGMIKTDLGTLRLTGANTYFGETRVLAGNLIQSGGTLGGTAAESALRVAIDPGSTASLAVTNGAVLTSTAASIATQTNSTGTVNVSGAGSRWNIVGSGGVRIGGVGLANSRGLVEILDGGVVNFSPALLSVAGGSTVRVSGTGSRLEAAATLLFNQGGGGALTLENGGVARAQNFEFGETSALTVRSGARLETTIGSSLTFGTGATMLVTGTGSRINSAGPFSFGGNTVRGGDLIIEDNAIVTSSANTDSGLGFDSGRNMIVRSGGQFNLTGGTGAGLQMENSNLLVDNASVTMGGGFLLGSRFGNNTVTLLNANLTAGSITARGSSIINVGGTRTGAAGAVGIFDVADVSLVRFDSGVSAELNFNHTSNRYVIASKFAQNGRINLIAGNTVFTGDSAGFAGNTQVTGGSLIVNNRFGTNASVVGVGAGAMLGGTGTVGGTVTVTGGTIAAGDNGVGTLTINGALILDAASRLAFQLGAPNTPGVGSDLINVTGNVTLDGTVDISNAGGFGLGLYRLINYTGTLTNNGLLIGAVPGGFSASDLTVQTSVARQVNLIVAAPPPAFSSFSFWDGPNTAANNVIDGGTGTWTAAGRNWTVSTGKANGAYDPAQLLIFAGTGGVVTADTAAGAIAVNRGLQFANNGYRIEGGDLTLGNNAITLRVGDGTAAGAGITATIASNLVGGASIEKTDLGTLILTGNVAPTGGTRITNGTLQIGAGGTGGTIAGNITNNGTLVFNRSGSLAFADIISGMGSVEQRGPGTLALSGVNSYTGTTTVSGGTLANSGTIVGATNVLAAGTLTNGGTIAAVTNAGTGTNTGNMGALTNNAGSFTNNGTIAGAVTNNVGAAFITTATLNGDLINSGTARIGGTVNGGLDNRAGSVTATAATSGIGALTQGAGAAFNLAGFAVITGSVAGDGAVQLGAGALTTGGNNSNTTFVGVISGTGRVIKTGTGQLTLAGANTYSGGTTVAAGTLVGNTQSLQGAIINEGRVRFDQANAGIYAGALSGAGILEKTGAGRLEYTGTGSMSGSTLVTGGEFAVNGALARSVVTVGTGARLSGGGTIGGIIAQSGSVVAPGNSVGTLTVQGNVLFSAGSTYAAEVIEGAADRITATGTAQLAGTLAITAARGPYMFGTPYVLLSAAGGRTGTFDATTGLAGFGAGIRSSIIYDGTTVALRLDPNALGPILGNTVLTPNQRSAQQRFDAAIASGSTNPSPFFPIFNLAVGRIPTALDALSGEVHATAARLVLDDERMVRRTTIDQLRSAPAGTGSGAWGTVFGSYGKIASDGNAARVTRDTSGFITGVDAGGTFGGEDNGWRVGVQAHHMRTTFGITDRAANGSLNRTGGGAYGSLNFGDLAIRGGAALASVRTKTARAVTASGFAEQATSARKGTAFQAFGEVGYKIGDDNASFEPFASLNLSRFKIGGITESGGVSAVTVNAADYDISFTELGLRSNMRLTTGETEVIMLRSALAVRQMIGDRAHISDIAFTSSPTLNFSIASVAQDKTSFAPELGIDGDLGGGLSVNVSYTGVIGKRAEDHGIKAGLRLAF